MVLRLFQRTGPRLCQRHLPRQTFQLMRLRMSPRLRPPSLMSASTKLWEIVSSAWLVMMPCPRTHVTRLPFAEVMRFAMWTPT
ncbi:hypothetical protein DPMN_029503 [Dreissena polymorpha]|uniref:Uncharacterized protein n=1 Tax=Dreissena polymorpha TaxID=45954 RepID=A0A9D4LZ71_DREPO|nr:hypothetical protein DPMN_029503 [Dreissena polymorpha]